MNPHIHVGLSADPLDVTGLVDAVRDPSCGGIAIFVGTVRESASIAENRTRSVVRLEYEAHEELAAKQLGEIALDAARRWGLVRVVAMHRTGICELEDPTVVVACSAPHRGEALDACRYLIDTVKGSVPIFKKEVYSDGSAWVGSEDPA